jgi:hypothetical protein
MKSIGDIGNYYGGLFVKQEGDKYYWSIEDWNGHGWQEIPQFLYDALLKFQEQS